MFRSNKVVAAFLISIAVVLNACEKTEPEITTTDRDQFIGTYAAQSVGPQGQRNFTLTITASTSAPDQIRMDNFDGGNVSVFANVLGNSLTINIQSVSGETYQGTGNIASAKNLTIDFSIDDGQGIENRTLTGVKS
jgi:hypothetical protein